MAEYLSPGVFIEEVSSGLRPIEGVGTSTAAFVGRAIKGPVNQPTLVTNPSQFADIFGGFHPHYSLAYAVRHFFLEGGRRAYIVRVFKHNEPQQDEATQPDIDKARVVLNGGDPPVPLLRVLAINAGAWGNDISIETGGPAFDPNDPNNTNNPKFSLIVRYQGSPVETYSQLSMRDVTPAGLPHPLHVEAQINGVSKFIEVDDLGEDPNAATLPAAGTVSLQDGTDGQSLAAADFIGSPAVFSGLYAFDRVDDINIVAIPDLVQPDIDAEDARAQVIEALTYCENRQDCFFVADAPKGLSPQDVLAYKHGRAVPVLNILAGQAFNSTYGALYYPWIFATDPLTGKRDLFPPSGAIVGSYAATDVRRGVHKAPAGVSDGFLNAAVGIERVITKGEHDTLNPEGINVIRSFPESGIVIWGARTVSADPEFRYVNVRRLLLFLEESIEEGTQWVVFEPNDPVLWRRIRRNISAFLRLQWLEGRLVGTKEEEAFFVKCDEETNPPESVALGRVVTLVGVAPSKPAEFVIFRISQSRSGANVEE